MDIRDLVEQYKEVGYIRFNVFSYKQVKELNDYLESLPIKRYIPFSDSPWGWGNLLGKGPFERITNSKLINSFCTALFESDNYIFPNMMVNNKAPWIGPDVEWHREIFNVDTYAPGYSAEDWKHFCNIYVALDRQTKENGCLEIYENSHKIDYLENEDIIDGNLGHKRRVVTKDMEKVHEKCVHKYIELEPGEVLIFTHKTVHSSHSNKTSTERKSVVLGVRHEIKKYDNEVYKEATSYRRNFIVDNLQKIIDKHESEDMYLDFNKESE